MTLRTLVAAIGRYWTTFVGVTAPLLVLGAAGLYFMPLQYVSTTELLVSIQGSTTAAAYQNDGVVNSRISSYIPLMTSDVVSQRVIDKLRLPLSAPELAAKVSAVNVPPSTALIDVAVTDESPDQARLLADTLANEFISYAGALETPTGEDGQRVSTTVVTAASEPRARLGEFIVLSVAAAVCALAFGALAVWVRARRDHDWLPTRNVVVVDQHPVSRAATPIETPADRESSETWHDPAPAVVVVQNQRFEIEPEIEPALGVELEPKAEIEPDADVEPKTENMQAEPATAAADRNAEARAVAEIRPHPATRLRSRPSLTGGRELRLMSATDDGYVPTVLPDPAPSVELRNYQAPPVGMDFEQALPQNGVNGSRHRADDVGSDGEVRNPKIHVNGSRHRAEVADTAGEALTDGRVNGVEVDAGTPRTDEGASRDSAVGPRHVETAVKDWDGRRWIRRR